LAAQEAEARPPSDNWLWWKEALIGTTSVARFEDTEGVDELHSKHAFWGMLKAVQRWTVDNVPMEWFFALPGVETVVDAFTRFASGFTRVTLAVYWAVTPF